MIRGVTLVMAVTAALLALGMQLQRPAPVAEACSWVWPTLEERLDAATFVGIVRVVEAGGPENAAPTLTPTATSTATVTPEADETPGATATATFEPPRFTPPDLTGFSATIDITRSYVGPSSGRMAIDGNVRREIEETILRLEASGGIPPCPITLLRFRYVEGRDYVVIANGSDDEGLSTLLRWEIDGDDVLLRRSDEHVDDFSPLVMRRTVYDRHFVGIPAHFYVGSLHESDQPEELAVIEAERVPLALVQGSIEEILGLTSPVITPPDTGNAGLAAGR
jgi:hypothetical protein